MNIAGISQWSKDPLLELEKIKEASKFQTFDKFVLYGQPEWAVYTTPGFYEYIEFAEKHNKKLIAISGAAKIFKKLPFSDRVDYRFYPSYFLTHSFAWLYQNIDRMRKFIQNYNNHNFKHSFITYNYRAHSHRCEMIDLVYFNNLFENNSIVWHHNSYRINKANEYYEFKYWLPCKIIPENNFEELDVYDIKDNYWNSFAQLVSESTEKALFITEKTAVPLFLKKPFLVATAPGYHHYLKTLGFELYDEIFNYNFDIIGDRTERYNTLLQNFVRLRNLDLQELHEKIKDKLEFNRQRAVQIATQRLFIPDIIEQTLKIHDTGIVVDSVGYGIINQLLPQSINTYRQLHGDL